MVVILGSDMVPQADYLCLCWKDAKCTEICDKAESWKSIPYPCDSVWWEAWISISIPVSNGWVIGNLDERCSVPFTSFKRGSTMIDHDPPLSLWSSQCPASTSDWCGWEAKPSEGSHFQIVHSTWLISRPKCLLNIIEIYCTYPTLLPSEWTGRFPLRKTLKKSRRPVSQMFSPAQGLPWQLLAAVGTCKWKCLVDWRRIFRPWMGEVWLARCYSRMHAWQFIDRQSIIYRC